MELRVFFYLSLLVNSVYGARILAVYPFPSISHQVVFRALTLELVKRGHEVLVVTTDPAYPKGQSPPNLREIDVHNVTYDLWISQLTTSHTTLESISDRKQQIRSVFKLMLDIFEKVLLADEVQNIIKHKYGSFDLLFVESFYLAGLIFSHEYNIPTIQFSSFGSLNECLDIVGATKHPLLYPAPLSQRTMNLTNWEKVMEFYKAIQDEQNFAEFEEQSNILLKKYFGPNTPSIAKLKENVDLLFLNTNLIWDNNRPSPPNLVYLGGLHQKPAKDLPTDLKSYLDSSKNGVIYISFGTNVEPAQLPPNVLQALTNGFSKLPYDVLWKWNKDELPGRPANVKISKWLPQADLLRHPKIKLFITQGGLQSTDEAITTGVPLIGMPIFGDQWYNVEKYVTLGIGAYVKLETINDESFLKAVQGVINNDSYRQNMQRLRSQMRDQPQSSLERAVWWTENVLRHKGARHLRSPAANISSVQYLELELVSYLLLGVLSVIFAVLFITIKLYQTVSSQFKAKLKSL